MYSLPPEFIPYVKLLTPPVIGAFIGYLTNRVAIKMLFRPLKAWRIGKIRVPMTPGVIPSKRHELAQNMGEVVGDHLLTSEEVGKGLQHVVFQNHLYNLIYSRIDNILEKDLDTLGSIIPEKFQVYFDLGTKTITFQVKEQIRTFIKSEKFETILDNAVETQLTSFLTREIETIFPVDKRETGYDFLEDNIARMFQSEAMEQWVDDFVHQKVYSSLQQEKSLADVLPDSLSPLMISTIEKQVPVFLKRLASIVQEPDVRDKVVIGVCVGVEKFIDSLGSMADMVRGFLRMEMVEAKVREYLDEKDDDIVAWLQSEEVQLKVSNILRERSGAILNKPIVEWVKDEDEKAVDVFCQQCVEQILLLIRGQDVASTLSSMIKTNLENHIDSGSAPLGTVLADLLGTESLGSGKAWLKREVKDLLQSPDSLQTVDSFIDSLVHALVNKKIGRLSRVVPGGIREGLAKSLQNLASNMLATEVPGLVQSLNIRKIVVEKVNSLDLLRLERLLLSIMEEQFKYINLFGALLGFLIGCLNVVIINFM